MIWAVALLVAVAFIAGCAGVGVQIPGNGPLVAVTYDEDFENHRFPDGRVEADALREGVRFWNQRGANLHLADEIGNAIPAATYHLKRDDFSWPSVSDAPTGVTWPSCGDATIYPNVVKQNGVYDYEDFRSVVAHEVGHAIGLFHIAVRGIMYPNVGWPAAYPSEGDIGEYRRVWGEKT